MKTKFQQVFEDFTQNRTLWLVFLPVIAILFGSLPKGSMSQNFEYHSMFSQLISKGDILFQSIQILPSSLFSEKFIDQHFGFHLLLAAFSFGGSPLIAFQIILGISFAGIFVASVFGVENKQRFIGGAIGFLLMTLACFESQRLFWGRPTILSLLSVFIFPLTLAVQGTSARTVLLFLVGILFATVSFESLIVTFISVALYCLLLQRFKDFLVVVLGLVISLYIPTFDFSKIVYLTQLLKYNLSEQNKILEWQAARLNSPIFVFFFLIFTMNLRFTKAFSRENIYWFIFSSATLVASFFYARFLPYFYFSLIPLAIKLFLQLQRFESVKQKNHWIVLISILVALFLPLRQVQFNDGGTFFQTRAFVEWYQNSVFKDERILNFKWEYWSSILNVNPSIVTEPGFSPFIYEGFNEGIQIHQGLRDIEKLRQMTYDDFEFIFDRFKSQLILVDTKGPHVKVFEEFKSFFSTVYRDDHFVLFQFLRSESSIFSELSFLVEQAKECAKLRDESCTTFIPVEEDDEKFIIAHPVSDKNLLVAGMNSLRGWVGYLDKINSSWIPAHVFLFQDVQPISDPNFQAFFVFPFFKDGKQFELRERYLRPRQPNEALEDLDNYFERTVKDRKRIYYDHDQEFRSTGIPQTRIFLGMYYYCFIDQFECQKIISRVKSISGQTLGALGILGLASMKAKMEKQWLDRIAQTILSRYNVRENVWYDFQNSGYVVVDGQNYIFSVGEAISFLNAYYSWNEIPWLEMVTKEYFNRFQVERNVFFVRWLSSSLYFSLVNNKDKNAEIVSMISALLDVIKFNFIENNGPYDLIGCYQEKNLSMRITPFDHRSGLLLEGIAHFERIKEVQESVNYQNLTRGLLSCVTRMQLTSQNLSLYKANSDKLGAFPASPSYPLYRVDVFAHIGIGLHLLAGQVPY